MGGWCCTGRDAEAYLSLPLGSSGRKLNLRMDNLPNSPMMKSPYVRYSEPCATCMYFRRMAGKDGYGGMGSISEHVGNGDTFSHQSQRSKFLQSPSNSYLSKRRRKITVSDTQE